MKTIAISYVFAADHNEAVMRSAFAAMSASTEELAHTLSEQAAGFPLAETPGDAADELFYAADNATQAVFALSDLLKRAARRLS